MRLKWWLGIIIAVVFIVTVIASIAPSVTFRPALPEELTARVVRINNISTDSFYQYSMNHPSTLAIMVEVIWNDWRPVTGASVTIYDAWTATEGTTDADGRTVLCIPFPTPTRPLQEKRFLSLMASKGTHMMAEPDAIPIYYQ